MLRSVGLAAALTIAGSSAARACTVPGSYRAPTALDMAAAADAIVVAKVVGSRKVDQFESVVFARPVMVVKGALPRRPIVLEEAVISTDPQMVYTSPPRELREPNEGALLGSCTRYAFRMSMNIVLFLKRDASGKLVPYRRTFARDAEDVAGPDALWIKALREYSRIARAPAAEWNARLRRRAAVLRVLKDRDARAIARDMQIELLDRARRRRAD